MIEPNVLNLSEYVQYIKRALTGIEVSQLTPKICSYPKYSNMSFENTKSQFTSYSLLVLKRLQEHTSLLNHSLDLQSP